MVRRISGPSKAPWWFVTPFECVCCGTRWVAENSDKVFVHDRRYEIPPNWVGTTEPTAMYMDCPECRNPTYISRPYANAVQSVIDDLVNSSARDD